MPKSYFRYPNKLYKTADKVEIDQVAGQSLKAKHLCKTEEGKYSISIMNQDLDHIPTHTREQISAAIEEGLKAASLSDDTKMQPAHQMKDTFGDSISLPIGPGNSEEENDNGGLD